MKFILKPLLQYYLKLITKLVLVIHRPQIIAVAGSTNKSFVRDEIKKVLLKKSKTVRANPKNFNTEIGLPLAILGIGSGYNSYRDWLPVIGAAAGAIFTKDFPPVLVLELGVARRGDMRYLMSLVHPEICVITNITQRYIESFAGLDQMVREYACLVKNTAKSGKVLLNYDNLKVRNLAKYARAEVIYFGQTVPAADGFRIQNIVRTEKGETVEICYKKQVKQLDIPRFGEHHAYAVAVGEVVDKIL